MTYPTKRKKGRVQPVMTWVLLLGILLLNHCSCRKPLANKEKPPTYDEVIVFLGRPGAGKSTLCNTIFQEKKFESLTRETQECIHGNKKYIITSDLWRLEDSKPTRMRRVEKVNNYKIVFVVTFGLNRAVIDTDAASISAVCNHIKADFEYGIIVNKVPQDINQEALEPYRNLLIRSSKQPHSAVIIRNDEHIKDKAPVYFPAESDNRKKLLTFMDTLKASKMRHEDVVSLMVRTS